MVPLDRGAIARALELRQVHELDAAHAQEHCLEVHLPFLQRMLDRFRLVPFVVGDATPQEVSEVLDLLWGAKETLIVVSSDLSHYLDYETARATDFATSLAIVGMKLEEIHRDQACGLLPIQGLLDAARTHHLHAITLDLRNSGDTAGPRDSVVGYGAFAFE
jgi:AmmeMemoRadiSam system protein B